MRLSAGTVRKIISHLVFDSKQGLWFVPGAGIKMRPSFLDKIDDTAIMRLFFNLIALVIVKYVRYGKL